MMMESEQKRSDAASPGSSGLVDVLVARQPIFDPAGGVYAYELLYRGAVGALTADGIGSDQMSSVVLVNAFLNIGIETLVGDRRVFINLSTQQLLDGTYNVLNPGQTVVELLESSIPDRELIDACSRLVGAGYTLALDDYEPSDAYLDLLPLARIVKLDVLARPMKATAKLAEDLHLRGLELVAEKVETREVHEACRSLGFAYYQGFFFSRPQIIMNRELPAGLGSVLRLMQLLRDESTPDAEIERAFRGDMVLTLKLLRAVNAASFGGRGIESIRHALRLLGRAELYRWLSLLLVTSSGVSCGMDAELIQVALRRARMCETIAIARGDRNASDGYFIIGLFSLLDTLLKVPMRDVLSKVSLSPAVQSALLTRTGPLAEVLLVVEAFERGTWDYVEQAARAMSLERSVLGEAYTDSLTWAAQQLRVQRG